MLTLTAIVLSCRRLSLLERTLAAARVHFGSVEALPVRWICFDNGSSLEDRVRLARLGFDLLLLSKENLGQGPALNHLLACVGTEYFMLLEDDWVLENPWGVKFVEESIAILESDPKLGQVKLDALHSTDFTDRTLYDGPFRGRDGGVPFYVQNPRSQWGGFCCPPAITRTSAVRDAGAFREDQPFRRWWAESEYCQRFAEKYYTAKSPDILLFRHIGDEPSPGWKDGACLIPAAIELAGDADEDRDLRGT